MTPEFQIHAIDLSFLFTGYTKANMPILAPPSKHLASLQPVPKGIYDQLLELQWTDPAVMNT
ncbi:uncharacterized protein N7484_003455 [Penicillium longicatenatum]|uniref:uncharacterized protein n=1 Tax=Penicillium longicatenatum TaxID=1561947 RepID=UPI0025488880|nr:uncharacterized protein N7484_003455 [Penicillium longicatenatum]KAJ5649732.1 hypothetical protein N7484_003455 [Penicillium longicatenatum]